MKKKKTSGKRKEEQSKGVRVAERSLITPKWLDLGQRLKYLGSLGAKMCGMCGEWGEEEGSGSPLQIPVNRYGTYNVSHLLSV